MDNFIVFDEENVDFFEDDDDDDETVRDEHPPDAGAFPGEMDEISRPRSPAKEFQWVACECGATEDDGRDDMIQCCNARCGVWQHVGCVDVDPDGTTEFFCANCAAQGGHGADPPPGKPSRLGRGGAFASVLPRTQTAWSQRMARGRSEMISTAGTSSQAPPQPPSRAAMLCRAAVAGAAECVRLLVGKTSTVGIPLASKKEIGRALHKALAAGHRPVVEAIRAALGEKLFVNSSLRPHDAWPLGPNGYTLVHSAAANAKADPGCVWLALEATGEPPGPSDEFEAFNAAAAARAVPPPPPPPLLRKSTMGEDDEDDENTKEDDENTKEEKKDAANTDRGGVPEPSFSPSAATTAPLLGPLALLAHGPFYLDRPAACLDEAAVTLPMLAAGAGVGYEGSAALLRAARAEETASMWARRFRCRMRSRDPPPRITPRSRARTPPCASSPNTTPRASRRATTTARPRFTTRRRTGRRSAFGCSPTSSAFVARWLITAAGSLCCTRITRTDAARC